MKINSVGSNSEVVRTTIVLPIALDENLEIYALKSGLAKNEAVKQIISEFLVSQGLQPDRRPRHLEVAY